MRSETEFISLASQAGIQFTPGRRLPWLTNKGHLADSLRGVVPFNVLESLGELFRSLGGDEAALRAERAGSDPCPDIVFEDRGWLVEYDEQQHFTTDRLTTFDRYPTDINVAYNIDEYRALARRHSGTADRYRAAKQSTDFPFHGGRRSQRAYFDAVRDLVAPFFGLRVFRVPAPERDAKMALDRFRRAAPGELIFT
jgi:hypothetical protein